ncbi:MAG: MFS transporter [Candidatus Omnitrophica bacterium]|nr:MFS transporter [Candidatus Omnitrophota bacterium]
MNKKSNFLILSWAMYDMANQFFALNIVSLYFVRWITLEKGAPEIFYSIAFGLSTILIALLAPILGTIADIRHRHRHFLIFFTMLSVIFTICLAFTEDIFMALLFFAIANIGCQTAVIFYNALMLTISPDRRKGLVSGLGKMFGYFGAIIALIFTKPIIIRQGYQATFFLTGCLFFLFSLPCLIFVKDKSAYTKPVMPALLNKKLIVDLFRRLRTTLFTSKQYSGLREFLKAAFFGLCVVNVTMLFMSIYVTKVFGLNDIEIINFVAFATIFAIIGSIGSGVVSDWIGYKRTMMGIFSFWILCLFGAALAIPPFHWMIGALAGISLGSTWVVSRALVISVVPREMAGEAFGLFNLVGYLSAAVGPIVWGLLLLAMGHLGALGYRLALMSFIPFLIVGSIFLLRVPNIKSNA